MKILKLILTLTLLFSLVKSYAQTPFLIQGGVIDAQTQETLPFVNITDIEKNTKGTTTNGEGIFQIEISKLPTTLQFSFIGYESQTLEIKNDKTREFVIELKPSTESLPEISVSAKRKIDTVFFEPYSIVDYIFFENKILLLAHRNSIEKYTLVALDEKTQEPIAEYSLKNQSPKGLLQHCTGEAFLITEANAHEISIDSNGISFPKRILLDDFYLIDHPCVLATEKFFYFGKYFYQGQAMKYIAYARDSSSKKNNTTPVVIDSIEKYEFPLIQHEDNIVRLIEEVGLQLPWSGDIWDKNMSGRLWRFKESNYYLTGIMKIFYPKLNTPIFQKGNKFIVFNHFESELQFFTEKGDSLHSIPIDYHKTRKWKKQIFFDNIQQRAYTTFNTRWGEVIREVNIEDGKMKEALTIDLAFIEKAKVRNGFLYFLYKDTWGGERKRILHRMKVN